MQQAVDVNDAMRKTAPFAAWLVAYGVAGGAVFLLAVGILNRTASGDLSAMSVAVLAAVIVGWMSASWVQRRVASRVEASKVHRQSA